MQLPGLAEEMSGHPIRLVPALQGLCLHALGPYHLHTPVKDETVLGMCPPSPGGQMPQHQHRELPLPLHD